ncbi:hypothetical protein [Candidatus Pyrohabitans sp.]
MIASFVVTFREALEAALIIGSFKTRWMSPWAEAPHGALLRWHLSGIQGGR